MKLLRCTSVSTFLPLATTQKTAEDKTGELPAAFLGILSAAWEESHQRTLSLTTTKAQENSRLRGTHGMRQKLLFIKV